MSRYLTTQEAADQIGVSPQTVRRWISQRGLKWHDVGVPGRPRVRISPEDLAAWVEDPDTAPSSDARSVIPATPAA